MRKSPQAQQSRSFYILVLIGVAAFSAVFGLHDLDVDCPQVMGQRSSKARPSARGVACPPQWLPVLLCIATPSPSPQPPSPSPPLRSLSPPSPSPWPPPPMLPPPPPSPSLPSFPQPSPPPPSASPPPTPSPPPSTEVVVLMLTASGSVNDYANTSGLQSSIAEAAGVRPGAVAIKVEAASVRITALITLEAGTTVAVMQALRNDFATPDAASSLLGITVVSVIFLQSTSSKDEDLTWQKWERLALLITFVLLVAALVLLYRRHLRDRANMVLSRDRANFDLQMSVHVNHRLQRAFREAQGNNGIDLVQREQAQADDTASLSSSVPSRWRGSLSNGKGPPSTLPPGPPSSSAGQSVVEQEMVISAPTPPPDTHAMPAAPTPPAPGYNWVRPWCGASKEAPAKRPAPPGPVSAPRAKKKAFTSPYHEFCREQRPLLPPHMSNADREKLLGEPMGLCPCPCPCRLPLCP